MKEVQKGKWGSDGSDEVGEVLLKCVKSQMRPLLTQGLMFQTEAPLLTQPARTNVVMAQIRF